MSDSKKAVAQALMNQQTQKLADLYGGYIDKPNDPNSRGSLQDMSFFNQFRRIAPDGYNASDIGVLQQNPQYRGIRMVLPQSGGSYGSLPYFEGQQGFDAGQPRIMTEGPTGLPDPNDPHQNGIPLAPPNIPPDQGGLQQQVYGELIRRGYPVLGGSGEMGGDFQAGFNPIGFGQR